MKLHNKEISTIKNIKKKLNLKHEIIIIKVNKYKDVKQIFKNRKNKL